MPEYLVKWLVDIEDGESVEDAAAKALKMQRNPESIATCFVVKNKETGTTLEVDLFEGEVRTTDGLLVRKIKKRGGR